MSVQYVLHNHLDLLYVVTNADGGIVFSNDNFKESTSHIQPRSINDFVLDLPEMVSAIDKAKKQPLQAFRVYTRIKQKNQNLRWTLFNVFFIINSLHIAGYPIFDITNPTTDEFEKQKALLEDIQFIVSHEIRRPIPNILGIVDIMEQNEASGISNADNIKMMKQAALELDDSVHRLVKKAHRLI